MFRSRLLSGFFCTVVVVTAAARGEAAALDAARQAYADLAYEACRDQGQAALLEKATLKERVDAYRLVGLCQAALGDTEAALDAFVKLLALDPDAELPSGLSPRFTSSYLEAKGYWVGKKPLDLVLEEERVEGKKRVVRLAVIDAAGLVDKVAWEDDEGERAPGLKAAERMELEVPAELVVKLVGLDQNGGVVVERVVGAPPVATASDPSAAAAAQNGDAAASEEEPGSGPWLWVGVAAGAGVLVAAGAAAGLAGFLFLPPDSVTLESQVVFGNP